MRFIFLIVVLFAASTSSARETRTEIGRWDAMMGGSISFSVVDREGAKTGIIYVSDEHVIETNFFSVSVRDMKKIRDLLDETIKEIDSTVDATKKE